MPLELRHIDTGNSSRRVELARQRQSIDFEHETIELHRAFRTAPEPLTLHSPPRSGRCRATSASMTMAAPRENPQLKKKKTVSFRPEHEQKTKFCSCQSLTPRDKIKDMPSPLHAACRRAEVQVVKHLLSCYFGADLIKLVNSTCACGRTPLEVACEVGDVRVVKLLLKRHADPNNIGTATPGTSPTLSSHIRNHRRRSEHEVTQKPTQQTCLRIACKTRKTAILDILMQYGAKIDDDALLHAAIHGYDDVVQTLVNFANAYAKKKTNPVHQLFLKKGAETAERSNKPLISTSLRLRACSVAVLHHPDLIPILLGDGKNSLSKQNIVQCAIGAVNLPDYRLVKHLAKIYDARLLIDARETTSQSSLLHLAVKRGSAKIALLLIKLGADVHVRDGSGIPPLYLACARGQELVVQTLVEQGAKCTAVGPSGETPLHIAAQENQLECVKLLLELGHVPVDDVTQDRCTALHLASQRGNTAVAACLLNYGANVNALTIGNESPLLKASRMSQFETVKLLLAHNASVSSDENQKKIARGGSFDSLASSSGSGQARSRSWSSSAYGKTNERIFIAKSNTHTSLKHWLRSVLHN